MSLKPIAGFPSPCLSYSCSRTDKSKHLIESLSGRKHNKYFVREKISGIMLARKTF